MSLKVDGLASSVSAEWDDATGGTAQGQAGFDWGSAPLIKGKAVVDADGDVQELSETVKLTVPVEGILVSAEESGSYVRTADGFKLTASGMGGANVDGVDLKAGSHVGIEDKGEHGFRVNAGPDVSAGMGEGTVLPGMDLVEGELKSSADFSYGEEDGQTTIGVQRTDTASGKVMGQTVAQVQNTSGVSYSTGPQGETVTLTERVDGTVGWGDTTASGSVGAAWQVGTDAQGGDIDRLTLTDEGKVSVHGFEPVTGGDQVVIDNATGIHDIGMIDTIDVADTIDTIETVGTIDTVGAIDTVGIIDTVGAIDTVGIIDIADTTDTIATVDAIATVDIAPTVDPTVSEAPKEGWSQADDGLDLLGVVDEPDLPAPALDSEAVLPVTAPATPIDEPLVIELDAAPATDEFAVDISTADATAATTDSVWDDIDSSGGDFLAAPDDDVEASVDEPEFDGLD
jgi:hypothetical protein